MRGQANLLALAIALIVVTTVASVGVVVADGAFTTAQRDATERATAIALADRIVGTDSPVTDRRNVLNESLLEDERIDPIVPTGADIRITVDGDVLYERGDPVGGTTIRRLAILSERQSVTIEPRLDRPVVTLPRRSPTATVRVDPDSDVETVRANDRVVLYDRTGIDGEHDVRLSRYETTTLEFDGVVDTGEVSVTYYPRRTTKALVEVTVSD